MVLVLAAWLRPIVIAVLHAEELLPAHPGIGNDVRLLNQTAVSREGRRRRQVTLISGIKTGLLPGGNFLLSRSSRLLGRWVGTRCVLGVERLIGRRNSDLLHRLSA